ncbi:MAG: cyclase [Bacteroidetes bacterium]|nr:cyclase [Bacteroidota bacterium]
MIINHKVKDFDAWLKVYDGEGVATRAEEGMVDVLLARGIDDPNIVYIVFDITDMEKAKAALSSESKKNLMMSAGVEGAPKMDFYTTAE